MMTIAYRKQKPSVKAAEALLARNAREAAANPQGTPQEQMHKAMTPLNHGKPVTKLARTVNLDASAKKSPGERLLARILRDKDAATDVSAATKPTTGAVPANSISPAVRALAEQMRAEGATSLPASAAKPVRAELAVVASGRKLFEMYAAQGLPQQRVEAN
jgi:hypothetical protein